MICIQRADQGRTLALSAPAARARAGLVLPGAAGDALADRLVAVRPALQVIFMTGRPDAKTSLRAVAAGEAGFLGKPFGLRDLESAVRARLGPRGA